MDEAYDFRGGLRWGRFGVSAPLARMTISPHLLTIGTIPAVSVSIPRPPEVHVNKEEVDRIEIVKPWWRISSRVQIHGHSEPAPVAFTTLKPKPLAEALRQHGWPLVDADASP
ncbi:MAG: hypothetical protein WD826_04550 [Actinomycetota bacterium]